MEKLKISINKNDDLATVAEKVFSTKVSNLVLVVPKGAEFSKSEDNLKFIKKGLAGANRHFSLESVDEKMVNLSIKNGIPATNPFFDLVNNNNKEDKNINDEFEEDIKKNTSADMNDDQEVVGDSYFDEAEKELSDEPADFYKKNKDNNSLIEFPKVSVSNKFKVSLASLLLFLIGGWWVGVKILPKAEIEIVTNKVDWPFRGELVVAKEAGQLTAGNFVIPGQVFSSKLNYQNSYPASVEKQVEQKAKGKILIYNIYSSDSQPLVSATRFQTPDGKIFRITEPVIVPGAKINNGKIEPSVIEADVIADQAGDQSNVGPVAKLTVPGFKDTPKYFGFYGELKGKMTGGFIGKSFLPNEKELTKAKSENLNKLSDMLKMSLTAQLPEGFKLLDEALKLNVAKEEVLTGIVDEAGKFSLYSEASLSTISFREADLISFFEKRLKEDRGDDWHFRSFDFDYEIKEVNVDDGSVKLAVNLKAIAEQQIDKNELKHKIANKSEADLKALIYGMSGLKKASIYLSPFWVNKVPASESKINISID